MRVLFIVWSDDNTTATYRQSYRHNKTFNASFDPVAEFEKIKSRLGLTGGVLLYAIDCGSTGGVLEFERTGYAIDNHVIDRVPLSRLIEGVQ